jgi:hypothetical protein
MRRNAAMAPQLLDESGYKEITGPRANRKAPSPLKVKETLING